MDTFKQKEWDVLTCRIVNILPSPVKNVTASCMTLAMLSPPIRLRTAAWRAKTYERQSKSDISPRWSRSRYGLREESSTLEESSVADKPPSFGK